MNIQNEKVISKMHNPPWLYQSFNGPEIIGLLEERSKTVTKPFYPCSDSHP
jgi:hypothetical protein